VFHEIFVPQKLELYGISLQQTSALDTYKFFSCEIKNGAFLLVEATVCCLFYY